MQHGKRPHPDLGEGVFIGSIYFRNNILHQIKILFGQKAKHFVQNEIA